MPKILPKDTIISKYFEYKDKIFERMMIPDGRMLVRIVHTWGDGDVMKYGFEYSDGISRTGINPLHIVKIFPYDVHISLVEDDIDVFLSSYTKDTVCSAQ